MDITNDGLVDFINKQTPPEILVEIFELLPKSHLLAFVTTNSRFSNYGCIVLWKDRTLRNRRQFDAFVGTVSSKRASRDYAHFVHSLRIDDNTEKNNNNNIHFRPQELFLCIQNLSHLHTIHIIYDKRYPQEYADRFRFAQILQCCPAIKEFFLSNFTPKSLYIPPGQLPKSSSLHYFATELDPAHNLLTTLEIFGSPFLATETMGALAANLPRLKRLRISLPDCQPYVGTIPEEPFIAFAENCPNLREIYLHGTSVCVNLTDKFYSKLAANCKNIEIIEISSLSKGITANGVKEILKECPHLTTFRTSLEGVKDQTDATKLFGKKILLVQEDESETSDEDEDEDED